MCAYCKEGKPLVSKTEIDTNEIRGKTIAIQGRRIVRVETIIRNGSIKPVDEILGFEMDYCPKCGEGLAEQTVSVQELRESDK